MGKYVKVISIMKFKKPKIFLIGLAIIWSCNNSTNYDKNHFEFDDLYDFYTKQSPITIPGKYGFLYNDLPDDPDSISKIVQGLLISDDLTFLYDIKPFGEKYKAYHLNKVEDILNLIYKADSKSLILPRMPENRLPVICSNFATVFCSMLRHKKIPARVRSGYATYFTEGKYENHYICEYWDREEKRWIIVDPQLDNLQQKFLNISFNTKDIPKDKFISAGQAWQLCRKGLLNPLKIGMGGNNGWESFGWKMLRPGVYSDFIALNKFELQPWEINTIWDNEHQLDVIYIDSIAQYTTSDKYFEKNILLFQSDERLKLPKKWKIR